MKVAFALLLLTGVILAQANEGTKSSPAQAASPGAVFIPEGTKVPLALKHAISTKGSREGDAVYAETTFPVVANGRVLVPAGTYVQGRISHIQRAGRVKGRAEVLMHFTSLIYPSGYTVLLPGAVQNAPGVDKAGVKDEGAIQADGQTGEKLGKAARNGTGGAAAGAVIGGLPTGSAAAAGLGAGIGGAAGVAWALLSRGNDVKLDAGTTVEMVIQRDIPLDPIRVPETTRASSLPQ
jgi:hypothetical protein